MNDIISTMGIKHKKTWFRLLDETTSRRKAIWEAINQDISLSSTSSSYYCLSSYAFNGTLNYDKAFLKPLKDKTARVQISYIKHRINTFIRKHKLDVILYWELSPEKLRLHCHGVVYACPAKQDIFKKFWNRNLGHALVKIIDDPKKWKDYCEKDLHINKYRPYVC